jgi:hypothetical protein
MLAINVVMVNGAMVGCTVSDRWNLEVLGLNPTHSVTEAKAKAEALGLTLRVRRTATVTVAPSKAERAALTPSLLGRMTKSLKRAMGA